MNKIRIFVSALVLLSAILAACGSATPIAVATVTPTVQPDLPVLVDWAPGMELPEQMKANCNFGAAETRDYASAVRYGCDTIQQYLVALALATPTPTPTASPEPPCILSRVDTFMGDPSNGIRVDGDGIRLVIFAPSHGKTITYVIHPSSEPVLWLGNVEAFETRDYCSRDALVQVAIHLMLGDDQASGLVVEFGGFDSHMSVLTNEHALWPADIDDLLARHRKAMKTVPEGQ